MTDRQWAALVLCRALDTARIDNAGPLTRRYLVDAERRLEVERGEYHGLVPRRPWEW